MENKLECLIGLLNETGKDSGVNFGTISSSSLSDDKFTVTTDVYAYADHIRDGCQKLVTINHTGKAGEAKEDVVKNVANHVATCLLRYVMFAKDNIGDMRTLHGQLINVYSASTLFRPGLASDKIRE